MSNNFAVKRLTAELKNNAKSSNPGIALVPEENDITRWHANIQVRDGPHTGTILHVLFVVPPSYPNDPPSGFFKHNVPYVSGASYQDTEGYVLCLDLLNNFRSYHSDWGNTASGWSPSYTLMTVCITLQGLLPEMFRNTESTVSWLSRQTQNCVCSCGHNGQTKTFPEVPNVLPKPQFARPPRHTSTTNKISASSATLWDMISAQADVADYSQKVPMSAEDQVILQAMNVKDKLNETNKKKEIGRQPVPVPHDSLPSTYSSSSSNIPGFLTSSASDPSSTSSSSSSSSSVHIPTKEELLADNIRCYAYGTSALTDPEETFGFGILAGVRNLSTPSEILALSSYEGGVTKSSLNTTINRFLPLYISDKHWIKNGRKLFEAVIPQLYQDLMNDGSSSTTITTTTTVTNDTTRDDREIGMNRHPNSHRRNSTTSSTGSHRSNSSSSDANALIVARTRPHIQCLLVLCSLINNTVVGAMSATSGSASEKFSNGYFAILRLLQWLKRTYPSVVTYADTQIQRFLASPSNRSKNRNYGVPNLGDFLVLLHVSDKYTWEMVGPAFMEECDARNVRWYIRDHPELVNLHPSHPDRLAVTFQATKVSRDLVCFQVGFLKMAKSLDLSTFSDMSAPVAVCDELRNIHKRAAALKNWSEFFAQIGLKYTSDTVRAKELMNAVKSSAARHYHNDNPTHTTENKERRGRPGGASNY